MTSEEMIRSVMCILAADGTVNAREKQFLQRICQQFHISNDVVKAAFEEIKQGKGRIALPNTANEQKQLFSMLVQAALADGTIRQQERVMLETVATKTGIPTTTLEQYLTKQRKPPSAPKEKSSPSKNQTPSTKERTSPTPIPEAQAVHNSPEALSSPNMMTCPKCGIEQPKALRCQQCGIFIKSYLKQQHKEGRASQLQVPISLYAPSGTLTIYALPLGILVGLIAAAGVGWLYQLVITWNPLIYLNVLATLIYGAVIGWAVGLGLQFGKCRNIPVGVVLAFIMAVIGDLLTFRYAYSSLAEVQAQVEIGWTISRFGFPIGIPIQGPVVYLIWGVEFILICVAAMAAATIGPGEPFCEECGQWTKKRHLGKIEGINEAYLLEALHEGNLKPFLQPPPQGSWKTVSYDLYSCPRCRRSRYLKVAVQWEEEGQDEEEVVLEYALITHEQIAELRETLKQCRD